MARKVVVSNIISADGFYAGPGGDVLALPFDGGFSAYNVERMRAADTLLLGRTSFAEFRGYWPSVADDPDAPSLERAISRLHNTLGHVVVSDSLTPEETTPWDNTRIVPRAEAHAVIADLKRQAGKEILVFGSRTLWNDLLVAGLVDELHLLIGPSFLGDGIPVFGGSAPVPLQLIEARKLDNSQLVLHRYGRRV